MGKLTTPRYLTAGNNNLSNTLFWKTVLNQSDIFAYNTANNGKGGPFGAQLWLFNEVLNEYILVGSKQAPEDSNAVLSKGRASAHAEAENLSLEKRTQVIQFLSKRLNQGWKIAQVSSGESCPSCRSKQVVFANELIEQGLIAQGDFHVIFKATYSQTFRDANFNDAPYDQTFRAVSELGILDTQEGLLNLQETLEKNTTTAKQIAAGELVFNAVELITKIDLPDNVNQLFIQAGKKPIAVVVRKDGSVLSHGFDERNSDNVINEPEKTAIMSALYKAADNMRAQGKFESWNLDEAYLITNVRDIGPMSYSETLWCNLSKIQIVSDYISDEIDAMAAEVPGISNNKLFKQVSVDYDNPLSPLNVIFNGDPEEASVAHLLWSAKMAMEKLQNHQAQRLQELTQTSTPEISLINGEKMALDKLISSSELISNYDGKKSFIEK